MEDDDLLLQQPNVAVRAPSKLAEARRSLMLRVYALDDAKIKTRRRA
jgi:hypothetical protein